MKTVISKAEFLLALSLTFAVPTFAEATDSTAVAQNDTKLSLSLDEAKKYALEHNRTIQNASYDVKKAEAARWKAISSMLPQVSGSVDYMNMCGHEMDMMGMKIAMPSYFDFAISASMTVGAQQIVGARVAKMAKEMSQIAVGKTEQVITSNIESSYISILALENMVKLLEKNVANLDSVYKMTMNAVRVGAAEQNAADQISVQVASIKSGVNTTKRNIEVLYNTIRMLIGASADCEIDLTQSLTDVVNPASILSMMEEGMVLDNNYDYQLQNASTLLAKKQVTLNKMAYVPTLTAFYSWDKKKYCSDEATMNMTPPNTVGLKLNVPIWSSGSRWADVKSAKLEYEKEQNKLEDAKLQLGIQESQLRYNLISAYENHEIQSNNIDVMQRVFKSNSEKYKYGTISSMQLTTSSTELVNAQNTYINALMDMVTAYVNLKVLLNK